ncbi:MAG: hypothetical protein ACPHV3_02290 [Vibrio sp.]
MNKQQPKRHKALDNFYQVLDDDIKDSLNPEQIKGVERAVLASAGVRHAKIDWRISFPFFFRRYFLVFMLGRDLRQRRREQSPFAVLILTLMVIICASMVLGLVTLFLYLVKSALGINIFEHYSFGVWDWFKSLWV